MLFIAALKKWPLLILLAALPHAGSGRAHATSTLERAPTANITVNWANTRGLYVFTNDGYLLPWAPRKWTLAQWQIYINQLKAMGLNHLQLPRAPWSERPGVTADEIAGQNLWKAVLQHARTNGFQTSLIYAQTILGVPGAPWTIRSPNNAAHPHWTALTSAYTQFANIYGTLVDEWHAGVDDPGGCVVCSGIAWSPQVSTAQCSLATPVCTIADYIALLNANQAAVIASNPNGRVVANAWGLKHWGRDAGYSTHLANFTALVPTLNSGIHLASATYEDPETDALQATGRPLESWPFYMIGHEFPVGLTKLHFTWTRQYLQKINNQGVNKVITHVSQPIEMMPAVFHYAKLLEDLNRSDLSIMQEFATYFVDGTTDRDRLANALIDLKNYWEAVSGVADWNATQLRPIANTPPYQPLYSPTVRGYLTSAVNRLNAITQIKTNPTLPMLITPTEWIAMLRDQAGVLRDAAFMDDAIRAGDQWLIGNASTLASLPEPMPRDDAQSLVNAYNAAGPTAKMRNIRQYFLRFWPTATGTQNPLGIIYDYLLTFVPADERPEVFGINGDFLESNPPGLPRGLKQLDGLIDQTDLNFCWLNPPAWTTESNPGYHHGSAARTTTLNSEVRIIFAGTGVSLLHPTWAQGGIVGWDVDGSRSGQINQYAPVRTNQVLTELATNLPDGLHILTLRFAAAGSGSAVAIDGLRIKRNARWRIENSNSAVSLSPNQWVLDSNTSHSRGTANYSIQPGATATIRVKGTGIALTVFRRADYGQMSWRINNGAAGSGTINLAGAQSHRYPVVLANNLANTTHTVSLTHASGFLVNLDAVDVLQPYAGNSAADPGLLRSLE